MSTCKKIRRLGTCLTDPLARWRLSPGLSAPDAKPFKVDAALWLDSGDTLTPNIEVQVPPPLKVGDGNNGQPAPINTTSIITLWLFESQLGDEYAVNIQFTTANNITHTVSALVQSFY